MSDMLNDQRNGTADVHGSRTHISTEPEELYAHVKYLQHNATLIYKRREGCVLLQRREKKRKFVNIANIPVWCIINVETVRDRQIRIDRHFKDEKESNPLFALESIHRGGMMDKKKKKIFHSLQKTPQRGVDETVYLHSRAVSDVGMNDPHHQSPTSSESAALAESAFDSPKVYGESDPIYYLHYVKHPSKSSLTPQTLEFSSLPDSENRADVQFMVQTILSDVYPRGAKRLILFVSPKSGSGNAIKTCQQQVMPVLRLTRHSLKVIVTTRAGHCEDGIADITNRINANDVIVCVGGDGIIHEAVNGLDRRGLINSWNFAVPSSINNNNINNSSSSTKNAIPPVGASVLGVASNTESELSMEMRREYNENEMIINEKEEEKDIICVNEQNENNNRRSSLPFLHPSSSSMPMIATIPAGSGCGMAKTLNVVTVRESVLALVHLKACVKDLMRLRFEHEPNENNKKKEEKKKKEMRGNDKNRDKSSSSFGDGFTPLSGLLSTTGRNEREGGSVNVSSDGIERRPTFTNRIAFMSTTFGVVNKIDRGSEKLRCLGNCRFLLYSIYIFIRGVRPYGVRFRYLPWKGHEGRELQKIDSSDNIPTEMEFPFCTIDHTCLHCQMHTHATNSNYHTYQNGASAVVKEREEEEERRKEEKEGVSSVIPPQPSNERVKNVNYDDVNLPWVSLDGNHCNIFISNIREVTKDVMIAPFAHMSDGAIDVVYSQEKNVKLGRRQFLKFFLGLEKGKHVKLPYVSYVKAEAIELEALEGGLMSDGEVMPFTKVRITPLRRAAEFVRGK
ncbi:putative sphingosine kinase A, B [Trypanosoma theileri]|uniref:Putative sphingosine kinase A, B n=1 Tax=Trypanosoma theileri TaxID=67003 RepID=A0A1X0NSV1_9TRYP|nr:putative sphingosine kinase A, B [Trypanosoma theileri]ORC87618.1 putative sphingosine kinase A, B [Trypanosoma theileri]